MKIFKILSIGVITFLGIPEGKTADYAVFKEDEVASKLSTVLACIEKHIETGDILNEAMRDSGLDLAFSGGPGLSLGKRALLSPEVFTLYGEIQDAIKQNNVLLQIMADNTRKLKGMQTFFVPPPTPDPFLLSDLYHGGVLVKEEEGELEPKVTKRVLTSENLSQFVCEIEHFRQQTIGFWMQEPFNHEGTGVPGTVDIQRTFDFGEMNSHLQAFKASMKGVVPSAAAGDNRAIFYENNPHDASQAYKKGLFGLVKIIDENQVAPLPGLFSQNNFLNAGKVIKDYIERHKA